MSTPKLDRVPNHVPQSALWYPDGTMRVKMVTTMAVDLEAWVDAYGLGECTEREIRDHVRKHANFTLDAALLDEGNGARVRKDRT